jgi:hypothetical protein
MIKHIQELEAHLVRSIGDAADWCVVDMDGYASSVVTAILCRKAVGPKRVTGVRFTPCKPEALRTVVALGITDMPVNPDPFAAQLAVVCGHGPAVDEQDMRTARQALLARIGSGFGDRRKLVGTYNRSQLQNRLLAWGTADILPVGDLLPEEVNSLMDYYEANGIIRPLALRDGEYHPISTEDRHAIIKRVPQTGGKIVQARGYCEY